eukprot:3938197-Rhodomonas_salina.7
MSLGAMLVADRGEVTGLNGSDDGGCDAGSVGVMSDGDGGRGVVSLIAMLEGDGGVSVGDVGEVGCVCGGGRVQAILALLVMLFCSKLKVGPTAPSIV